jgi:predicted extracellular nuclease
MENDLKRTTITLCLLFLCVSCVAQTPPTFPTATLPSATLPTFDGGTAINQIQGITHRSPMDGETIAKVSGVVTAVDGEGFYLQSQVSDGDDRTSEAIYVDLQTYSKAKPGDLVLVENGWVREWNPAGLGENSLTITTLVAKEVTVLSQNQPLPEPVVLGLGGRSIPDQVIENDVKGYVGQSKNPIDP